MYLITLTAIKLSPVSVANALAIIVFEQPGGPYMSNPRGGLIFNLLNESAYLIGHMIACCSFLFNSCCPPISLHCTLGISNVISLMALGFILRRAVIKSAFSIASSF